MEVASSLGLTWGEKEIHAPSLTVCSYFRVQVSYLENKSENYVVQWLIIYLCLGKTWLSLRFGICFVWGKLIRFLYY